MKNSNESIRQRHEEIVNLLANYQTLSVKELAQKLNISEVTIRRDLTVLDKMGLIKRIHGGGQTVHNVNDYSIDNTQIKEIKQALAKKAASFIRNNDTLFLNTSSTALMSLNYTDDKRLTVITNNVKIASIEQHQNTTIILSGGEIRFPKEALVGDIAIEAFSKMKADISIIGCSGITLEEGITTPIVHEAKINSLILEQTQGIKVVVADYRKIGQSSNFISSQIGNIDYLITDCFANENVLKEIENMGVSVIQVPI